MGDKPMKKRGRKPAAPVMPAPKAKRKPRGTSIKTPRGPVELVIEYHLHVAGRPEICGHGDTISEALYMLVAGHGEELKLKFK